MGGVNLSSFGPFTLGYQPSGRTSPASNPFSATTCGVPLHTESFSAAVLRGDSRSSAEANPSLFMHYTCHMYYICLPVRHQRSTRVPQN